MIALSALDMTMFPELEYAYRNSRLESPGQYFIPWDIMPGILLCQESGMIITDVYGDRYTGKNSTVAVFSSEELMRACVLDRNK